MRVDWNQIICNELKEHIAKLEKSLNADVISYYGVLQPGADRVFRDVIEDLKSDSNKRDVIYVILTTPGGSAETVQILVNILRYHYKEVNFIIPQYAYSAGTILCMSGDNTFMDYFSQLGPIDPQVKSKDGKFVPALGYLDKVEEMIAKVDGVMNAVSVVGDCVGEMLYYGAGAGGDATASAVISDLIEIAREKSSSMLGFDGKNITHKLMPRDKISSRYYIRLRTHDRAGVLARVSSIFSSHDISIQVLLQPETKDGIAELLLITHLSMESKIINALKEIDRQDFIAKKTFFIRIQD